MSPRSLRPALARARRFAIVMLVAACAAIGLIGPALGSPDTTLAMGPLPACRYDDILTLPRAYSQWARTLVDTILQIPRAYVPPDLMAVSAAGLSGSFQVRAVAIPDLTELAEAAKAAGNPIGVESAYRSYATQESVFASWVSLSGYKQALLYSARPGHSEHQLGLAIDFKTAAGSAPWNGTDWGQSPEGTWLRVHAWEYGFIQSYPKGMQAKTCYAYESWHFRYVGRAEAAAVHASGLTLREYLWRHYTTAVVPPPGSPTASHAPSAGPSASPSDSPGPSPSDVPSASPSSEPSTSQPSTADASSEPVATPGLGPPVSPVGTWLGLAPMSVALGAALAVAMLALLLSLRLGRRRRRAP